MTAVDCIVLGVVAGIIGPIGDLAESMLKRSFKVKDSGQLLPGQRVQRSQQRVLHLPQCDVDQAAGQTQRAQPARLVAHVHADPDRHHRDPRLVEGQVVDAGRRGRVVGHPEQIRRAFERRDGAIDQRLQARPRKTARGPDQAADLEEQVLELTEQ